jgi:hypothetical protein
LHTTDNPFIDIPPKTPVRAKTVTTAWLFSLGRSHANSRFATSSKLLNVLSFFLFFTPFIASTSQGQPSSKAGTSIRTVWNAEEGLWDRDPDKTFALEEDLVVGVEEGDENYLLGRVFDVAINSAGAIYVLDNGYVRVQKYDSAGVYMQTIGREGDGPGEFSFPLSITVDEHDNIYIADRSRVHIFDVTGAYVDGFQHGFPGGFPRSIRVNKNAGIYISCLDIFEQRIVHKYDFDHNRVSSFCDSYAIGEELDVRVEENFAGGAIDIDKEGVIYFTQRLPYTIRVFSPDGELLWDVYRDNEFVQQPIVEERENGLRVGLFTSSQSIIVFSDNRFVNVLKNIRDDVTETIIDLFDDNGTLLTSCVVEKAINLRCDDASGRLYGIDTDGFPKVVRYRVAYSPSH